MAIVTTFPIPSAIVTAANVRAIINGIALIKSAYRFALAILLTSVVLMSTAIRRKRFARATSITSEILTLMNVVSTDANETQIVQRMLTASMVPASVMIYICAITIREGNCFAWWTQI